MGTIDAVCPKCGTDDIKCLSFLGQYVCNDCGWKWDSKSQAYDIGELSELVGFKHTPEFDPPITWTKGSAATGWFPYKPGTILSPSIGEWCLWSTIIRGERNYFTGKLFELSEKLGVLCDDRMYFEPDETTYWARVRYIQEKDETVQQT